jgi:mono/diheme cytochrome c family protein
MLKKENYDSLLILGLALTLLIVFGFAIYLFLESDRVAAAAEELAYDRLQTGRAIYNEQCSSCHGTNGEGGVGTALNNRALLKKTDDNRFFSIARSGVPSTQMPAWSVDYGGPLTDEEIRSVVAYIRAWEPTAPVIEPAVFEPNAEEGAIIFESTCALCHGQNGVGTDKTPAINDIERLTSLDDDWYRSTIRVGRPAKGMPTWGTVLSPNQIEHLIALFDSWREGQSVIATFNITDLINDAIFSLEQDDPDSAMLQITRALGLMLEGPGKEILRNAESQLGSDDQQGSLATLYILRDQWPIGDPLNGVTLYNTYCQPCHGANGEGGIGLQLQPNEFVQTNINADLVAFIQEGRQGTAMAGFDTRLIEQEIADIVAHLRTWQP